MRIQLLTILSLGLAGCVAQAEDKKPSFKDEKEKVSYAIGLNIGNNWKRNEVEVDLDAVDKGIKDALAGGPALLTEAESREVLNAFSQSLRAKTEEKRKQLGEKNKKEGEAFLEENKTKPGVISLPSGLQYKVITEGTGEPPTATDTVVAHYRGTLLDGTEFDSSYSRNQPLTRPVNGVIKGWQEALQLMKIGSKWQLFIPAELSYGEYGSPPKIGPQAALIFEMELLSIQPPSTNAPVNSSPITSDIIKVPSAEELKKGAKIETIKADQLEKEKEKEREKEKK